MQPPRSPHASSTQLRPLRSASTPRPRCLHAAPRRPHAAPMQPPRSPHSASMPPRASPRASPTPLHSAPTPRPRCLHAAPRRLHAARCSGLEKSCHDMEKSGKMLEKKIQWSSWPFRYLHDRRGPAGGVCSSRYTPRRGPKRRVIRVPATPETPPQNSPPFGVEHGQLRN